MKHLLLFFLSFFFAGSAFAETGTQYVFIIDDSGSMGLNYGSGSKKNIAADPNRLATFAAQSMLMMLSPQDRVSVIRLNGGKEQPAESGKKPGIPKDSTPQMIKVKGKNRAKIKTSLNLKSKIAAYAGNVTPCRSALDRAQKTLNKSYERGAKQVVFFLTDGSCSDGESVKPATDWLRGVTSYKNNSFKFFLLTFKGRDYSKDLLKYTRDEEGVDIGRHREVDANDPIEIIQPFAEALAFSHGVEPIVLKPGKQSIPAHPAAAGVRLLSVDTDSNGVPIKINLKEDKSGGKKYGEVKRPRKLFHQWKAAENSYTYNALRNKEEKGRKFKASALRYIPNTHVVWGEAEYASEDWRVIAIPEYYLTMKTEFMKGDCSTIKEKYAEGNNPRVGEQACILVSIYNHTNQNVTADMVKAFPDLRVEMKMTIEGKAKKVRFKKIAKNKYFAYPLQFSKKGRYELLPSVRLLEEGLHLYGETYKFSTYEVSIGMSPSEIDFGTLNLGATDREQFEMTGKFKETQATFKVDFDTPNPCINIKVNDKGEGEKLTIRAGLMLEASATIDSLCGNNSFDSDFTGRITMQFPKDKYFGGRTESIAWRVHFTSALGKPDPLVINLDAGESTDVELASAISKIWSESPIDLDVVVAVQPTASWPEDLKIFFQGQGVNEDGKVEDVLEETGLRHVLFAPSAQTAMKTLTYHLASERCCEGGQYTAKVLFRPNGEASAQIQQDLIVNVNPKSKFDCYWPVLRNILIALGILLFIAYIINIFRKTHFMNADILYTRFVPLEYRSSSSKNPREADPFAANSFVKAAFSNEGFVNFSMRKLKKWFGGRFAAWLQANPLRLGLPGQPAYYECLQINLFDEPELFSVTYMPYLGMDSALIAPESKDNIKSPSDGFYVVATGVKPRFYYIYCKSRLAEFRPKSLHNTKEDSDETLKLSEPLDEARIFDKDARAKKNKPAGWLIR